MSIIEKMTPEKAKVTVAITKLMVTKCHACAHCKKERHVLRMYSVPNTEDAVCMECIEKEKESVYGAG